MSVQARKGEAQDESGRRKCGKVQRYAHIYILLVCRKKRSEAKKMLLLTSAPCSLRIGERGVGRRSRYQIGLLSSLRRIREHNKRLAVLLHKIERKSFFRWWRS